MKNINEKFYVVEVSKGSGVYLETYDIENGEGYITNTTKDILSRDILRIDNPKNSNVIEDIKNDAFSDNPRILKINLDLKIEEA